MNHNGVKDSQEAWEIANEHKCYIGNTGEEKTQV